MPAVRHLREADDVEPRFGALARRLEVRVGRRRAPVVLIGERPAAGRSGDAAVRGAGLMKDDNSVEKLMLDLVYGGHAGWAAAEFNLVEAGLIEMIQGHQPGLIREGDNGWMDLRWTLTDLGRRTRKARFELVMKVDPPLWAAEQDAEAEAQD